MLTEITELSKLFAPENRNVKKIQIKKVGVSPSGKAAGFGPATRWFESIHPSQIMNPFSERVYFLMLGIMSFNFLKQFLSKSQEDIDSKTAALLDQILQPSVICDACFFEGKQSEAEIKGSKITCHTCSNELEKMIIHEKGAQLVFYLPKEWSVSEKKTWVATWKERNFPQQ